MGTDLESQLESIVHLFVQLGLIKHLYAQRWGETCAQAAPGLCHPVAERGQRTRDMDQIKGDLIERMIINRAEARTA